MNNYIRTYKTTISAEKKAKRASKQLRDMLRREMFIEQKSISMAFQFSELTDEEMTDAFHLKKWHVLPKQRTLL